MHPERCTMALVRRNGAWVLWELKTACNNPASDASMLAVKLWLESSRGI